MTLSRHSQSSGDITADRRYQHALDFRARGDRAAAADLLEQALELAPGFAAAWFALGEVWEESREADRAAAAFERALAEDPADHHGAVLRLARLRGERPGGMPPAYVRALFDQYAPLFDGALVDQLRYRGPDQLRDLLARLQAPQPLHFASMADLGCGTGLVAHAFQDLYDRIVGVDLAPKMVAEARRKGLYADLAVSDMLTFLERALPDSFDLVIAADAFVYVGDLAPICAAAARALMPDGRLAFTVERYAGPDFVLGEKLRYAHGRAHLEAALSAAGLSVAAIEDAAIRTERGGPVPGYLVVAST